MDPAARPYLRTPSIAPDGSQIAFAYAGDIWLADAGGGEARRLTAHYAGNASPRWSPDGRWLAFTSPRSGGGDAYALALAGGELRRLTTHESYSLVESWSPDGAAVYFSAARAGMGWAIYRAPLAGGTPAEWAAMPFEQLGDAAPSPDGRLLALAIIRDAWWRRGPNRFGGAQIWVCANAPGSPEARPLADAPGLNRWPLWAPDGSGLYLVSDRDGAANVWWQPLDGGPAAQITGFRDGRVLFPSLSGDGRTIVFERGCAIWRLDIASGAAAPIDIRALPDQKTTPARIYTVSRDMQELALAPDGKKLAFITRGEVYADFADKETDKELRQGLATRVTATDARESDLSWGGDSRRLLYVSDRHGDPEVYTYEFGVGERRLTDSPLPKREPRASPDGAWVAYVCGGEEIRLINMRTGEDQPFIRAELGDDAAPCWSPDSAWVAFIARDAHHFENLYAQRVGEGAAAQLSFLSNLTALWPIWAPGGQFIIFATRQYRAETQIARVDLRPRAPVFREAEFERLFEQRPPRDQRPAAPAEPPAEGAAPPEPPAPPSPPAPALEIQLEGVDRRLQLLTPPQIDAYPLAISPDSRDLIFRAVVMGKPNLWAMALDEPRADQPARQLTASASAKWAAQFAPDGKSFVYLDGTQIALRKFPSGDTTYPSYSAEVHTDFHREKWQIFQECWRLLRDRYYDERFGGCDWPAVREQYAPLVAGAQTSGDLRNLLLLMLGELRASHHSVGYRAGGGEDHGHLGLSLDPQRLAEAGEHLIAGVLPDGPAAAAGLAPGEELLAIDGRPLGPEGLDPPLQRAAGRRVRLRVRAADGAEREVALRAAGRAQLAELRYRAWVRANEAIVHGASAGRLGYVHIPRMSYEAYQQFLVDLDAEVYGKQGLVLDLRYNGGGHTATFFLDVLTRRSLVLKSFRGRAPGDAWHLAGNRVLNRPTVLVVNEESASNAEIFAEAYRQLGVGLTVGRPTAGAVISTYPVTLIDGMSLSLPYMRVTTLDGEDMEGRGRPVDIEVALPLGAPPGRDPQLERAVDALLGQLG